MKQILFAITILLLVSTANAQPSKGRTAPEIILPDPNGQNISSNSLKGKIVLIDFWASWCGPCRMNNVGLRKLYEKYKDKGFEVYAVSLDENKSSWLQAIAEDKINCKQVNDASEKVANDWTISYIPQSFLLDKTGKIIAVDEDEKKLDKIIEKLLQ